jgi:hypothetical protein
MAKTYIVHKRGALWIGRAVDRSDALVVGATKDEALNRLGSHSDIEVGDRIDVVSGGRRTRLDLRKKGEVKPEPASVPDSAVEAIAPIGEGA